MYLNNREAQVPQKRKHTEYHDPDYASTIPASASKRQCDAGAAPASASTTSTENVLNNNADEQSAKYKKICEIIAREFHREIEFKHQQLKEIDDRIEKAFNILNRLRYAIVAEYYRKQTLLLPPADACSVRGAQTLYDDEPHGPQMALHPSLKKIIGKKPKTFEEILRACPRRAAAQTAKQTILVKSQSHKKREKRLRQLIREEGIVIDHSKDQSIETASLQQLGAADRAAQSTSKHRKTSCAHAPAPSSVRPPTAVKSLNANRLNNKTKHLIVVGNTSKYIGSDADEQNIHTKNKSFTHKWLVYVQAKDPKTPLELFVKKVRFFLHFSYRPNDVVDIYSPPYQIARRGWGEFPVRIQMFFEDSLKQKPVQLVHNLVLDKTLSGLQTLGAETLVEIWLRSQMALEVPASLACKKELTSNEIKLEQKKPPTKTTSSSLESNHKSLYPQSKDIDDNLFEFLNKIEETPTSICADIEKIQPTVMVSETITQIPHSEDKISKITAINEKSLSPRKTPYSVNSYGSINQETPCPAMELNSKPNQKVTITNLYTIKQPETTAHNVKSFLQDNNNIKANLMIKKPNYIRIGINPQIATASINTTKILPSNKALIVSKGNLISANNAHILKAVPSMVAQPTQPNLVQALGTKRFLQKKLVQLVDADGNIKYLQMLVATSTAPTVSSSTNSAAPVISTVPNFNLNMQAVNNNSTKSTNAQPFTHISTTINSNKDDLKVKKVDNLPKEIITKSSASKVKLLPSSLPRTANSTSFNNNQSKNVVFQKEGKVYIIDPMQVKLKQQQKKQVSLLKPQISLLKQKSQQQTPTICDHDYVPTPSHHPTVKTIEETNSKISRVVLTTSLKFANTVIKAPFQTQTSVPQLHLGIKQARANAGNILELSQQKRLELEQQFLAEKFVDVRQAVEYLLRRLPLIHSSITNSATSFTIFPFLNYSLKQFNNLPAFKQRAHEWLRAKIISKSLRSHADLKKFNDVSQPTTHSLWSTREILMFARFYAYTPPIKGLNKNKAVPESSRFTDLVKDELKNEKQMHYETITNNTRISKWIEGISKSMTAQEVCAADNQIIDVINVNQNANDEEFKCIQNDSPLKFSHRKDMLYLSIPDNLADASELVSDICKEASMRLQPEEISSGVIHPMSQTIMARCLSLFIEKLLRQVVGSKTHKQSTERSMSSNNNLTNNIEPQDVIKVINTQPEYDFLSNRHLGTTKTNDEFAENI